MVSKTAGYHSFVRLSLCDTACAKAMVQREGLAPQPPIRLEFNHFDDRFGGRLFWTANPAAPISAASRRWIERAALSIGSLHATLRTVFHRPSGPERAGAGDDRALPRHGDLEKRQDPPTRGLGPAPARLSALQGAQGALRAHEYRVRCRDARRAGALVQVQRRGAAAPDHKNGTRVDDAFADDEGGKGEVGPRPGRGAARRSAAHRGGQARGAGERLSVGASKSGHGRRPPDRAGCLAAYARGRPDAEIQAPARFRA